MVTEHVQMCLHICGDGPHQARTEEVGMDNERDEGTREKDKKERRRKGRNDETDVRLSSWRILFRKLSRTQESGDASGGQGRLT